MLRHLLASRALHPQATGPSLEVISVEPCEKLMESISIRGASASGGHQHPEGISIQRASAIPPAAGRANNILGQSLVSVLPILNLGLDFSIRDCVDPAVRCCAAGSSPPGRAGLCHPPAPARRASGGFELIPGCAGDVVTLEFVAEEEVRSESFAIIFASSG